MLRTALDRASTFGTSWCSPGREIYIPQNAYILCGERTLMLDTLSPASDDRVLGAIESVLADRPLDYLVVSHPDVPHAGNTARILRRYPDATLVAPRYGDLHALYHLEDSLKVGEGDSIDLGGRVVHFHEATFLDAPMHLWMTDEQTRTLFCVDWMGLPLFGGEGLLCLDEVLDDNVTDADLVDRYYEFHGRVMSWFQYVDVPKVAADMDWVRTHFSPDVIAPSHGPPVRSEAAGGTARLSMERIFTANKLAMARVRETGRVGVL
jgi:flavorubredoxin